MYSQRNKNKERFRTQVFKEAMGQQTHHQTKPYSILRSPPHHQEFSNSRTNSEPSILLINNLEKHIEYLQKKLSDSQLEIQKIGNSNEWLKAQILQKEAVIIRLNNRLQEEQQRSKDIGFKYENLQTDFANYQLQQKVDKLNRELNQQKEYQEQSHNQSRNSKKDRFSSAFLPSPFGSPKHYEERSPQPYQNITKESIPELNTTIKNPFEDSLWSEWKKLKNDKVRKEKEINSLMKKVDELKLELTKEKKESSRAKTELLRIEEKYTTQNTKLKGRIVNYIKDQKMLMGKLKINEQKMVELSMTMKQKCQGDGDKFFAHSSALQLQQIFQKITHNLQFDSATVDVTINQGKREEYGFQTEDIHNQNHEQLEVLQEKIRQISQQLRGQEKNWVNRLEEVNNVHMNELRDASDLIDLYKCRIQHLETVVAQLEREKKQSQSEEKQMNVLNVEPKNVHDVEVICDIISPEEWHDRKQILGKISQLMEVNQLQRVQIGELQAERQSLQERQAGFEVRLSRQRNKILAKVQAESDKQEGECINCSKSKDRLVERQMKILQSDHIIEELTSQKDYYYNAYQDRLTQYSNLQSETRSQLEKLKLQLEEKNKQLSNTLYENELRNEDYSRQREEVKLLKLTIEKLQSKVQFYEEQLQRYTHDN